MRGYRNNPYVDLDAFLQSNVTGEIKIERENIDDSISIAGGIRTPVGVIQKSIGNIIDAQRLTPFNTAALPVDDPRVLKRIPQASYNPSQYGDMIVVPVNVVAGTDLLALPRPAAHRIYLMVQNTLAANILYYTFDNPASANSIQIQPGGNVWFDQVVPQNDLHLYSTASGIILLSYINADIENGI